MTTRRAFLCGASSFMVAGPALANAPVTSLWPQLRGPDLGKPSRGGAAAVISKSGLRGEVSCAVADVKTGEILDSSGGDTALPPASVAKSLTTLYALERLGPEFRFQTRILATGKLKNGVLNGDLYLSGGGDPLLDTDDLAVLAASVKEAGIREVRGAFKVHEGMLPYTNSIDKEQPDHLGYSPAVTGIALNFNRVHFEWKPSGGGYTIAMDARTEKYRPEVQTAKMQVKDRKVPVYTYRELNGQDHWTVARGALGKGGSRWLPVRDPAAYAGDVFRTMARAQGIVLPKARTIRGLSDGTRVVAVKNSPPLRVILKAMLKYSNNLTAEMVGMTASAQRGGRPASLKESARRMSKWAADKYGMTGTSMVDHSGLGGASRMTANDLVKALVEARRRGILKPLLKSYPMRDSKGRTLKNHPIKVSAKTGTLNFVSALAGFMTAPGGAELAFVIFTADISTRSRLRRADRERPEGARPWNRRSRVMQQKLIEHWGTVYRS